MTKKEDQARLDAIHNLPCVCCISMKRNQPFPTEAHHIVDSGYRRLSGGHKSTLNLCGYHHRGLLLPGMNGAEMEELFGPSLALNKRLFKVVFGMERKLLEITNRMLDTVSANL